MSRPNGPATWRVTGQRQETNITEAGNFVEGLTVSFATGAGHTGSVFVPLAAATEDNVRAAIAARVAVMDGIAGLTHDGG